MAARAIWKGVLHLGKHELAVKLYSAVEDRTVHFRMLHRTDHAPVEQHIVRKDTGREVPKEDIRKAFALSRDAAVILEPDELESLVPPQSRNIELCRFIASDALSDQFYDRPYYLGPDRDTPDYFALAQAIERTGLIGIARWVMRKKRYLGALTATQGYLALTTLRRADQVLTFSGVEPGKTNAPRANELKLAEQLVASIEGPFDPELWQNEYRARLARVIEAKAKGEKLPAHRAPRKRPQGNLAESLKASLAAVKEQRVA
jgi:DNA end-binding protein Ku